MGCNRSLRFLCGETIKDTGIYKYSGSGPGLSIIVMLV